MTLQINDIDLSGIIDGSGVLKVTATSDKTEVYNYFIFAIRRTVNGQTDWSVNLDTPVNTNSVTTGTATYESILTNLENGTYDVRIATNTDTDGWINHDPVVQFTVQHYVSGPAIYPGDSTYPGITTFTQGLIVVDASDNLDASVTYPGAVVPGQVYPGPDLYPSGGKASVAVVITAQDTISTMVVERSELSFHLTRFDVLSVSLTETNNFDLVLRSSSDSLSTRLTEAGVVHLPRPAIDPLLVSITETATVVTSGGFSKTASDSLRVSVADSQSRLIYVTASDILRAPIVETRLVNVFIARTDSLALSVTEFAKRAAPSKVKIKVWTGAEWKEGILNIWTGTSWVIPNVRRWTGSEWI